MQTRATLWPRVRAVIAHVAAAGFFLAACGGSGPSPGSAPPSGEPSYEDAVARIPLEGTPPDWPLYWEVSEPTDPDQAAAVRVARLFEALEDMLIVGPVPREPDDLALLWVLATEERAELAYDVHAYVRGTNDDPWVGPRWIRLLDVAVTEVSATVLFCADEGFHGPVSRGGGREVWREHRAILHEYELVRKPAQDGEPGWLVDHRASYAGVDYPDRGSGLVRECERWAVHELTDVP